MAEGVFQFMGEADIVKTINSAVKVNENVYIAVLVEVPSGI
jgi:hypothetical protein